MVFKPQRLAEWCRGEWNRAPDEGPTGVSIDSRRVRRGDMFVALRTDTRDGHDFLENARVAGANCALVEDWRPEVDMPQLRAKNTHVALQALAKGHGSVLDAVRIGVTGSCGKTTTKDLLAGLMRESGATLKTEGNFNNLLGVPLTLLAADPNACDYAVVEAGISEPGEMDTLAALVRAEIVVFTAIGAAHLEGLGNVESVAIEKGRLAKWGGTRIAYLGSSCIPFSDTLFSGEKVIAREAEQSTSKGDYRIEFDSEGTLLRLRIDDEETYRYTGWGKGLANNVALALLVARDLGVSQERARSVLASWSPTSLRGQWMPRRGSWVYLDCYNANPLSMADALETFDMVTADSDARMFVIGCMEELGSANDESHRQLGESLALRPRDSVFVVGTSAGAVVEGIDISGRRAKSIEIMDSVVAIKEIAASFSGDIFIKGSRCYRLEEIMGESVGNRKELGATC